MDEHVDKNEKYDKDLSKSRGMLENLDAIEKESSSSLSASENSNQTSTREKFSNETRFTTSTVASLSNNTEQELKNFINQSPTLPFPHMIIDRNDTVTRRSNHWLGSST